MPPRVMTRKAAAAAAKAPIMKRRVLRRMASVAVISVIGSPNLGAQPRDHGRTVDRQHERRQRVSGHDEVPSTGDHAVPPRAGGGASSCFNRNDATRARSMMKAVIRKRIPKAFIRSGSQNCRETVLGLDCN